MKRKIRTIIFASAALVIAATGSKAQASHGIIDTSSARDSVFSLYVNRSCNGSTNPEYDYYISKGPIASSAAQDGKPEEQRWLVFVDKMPAANWEHPCEYTYVGKDKNSGKYMAESVEGSLPPEGIELEIRSVSRVSLNVKENFMSIIGKKNGVAMFSRQGNATSKFSGNTYALIISGGSNPALNASRYWNDCSFMYRTLTQTYGIPKDNIRVLMSDGKSPEEDQNSGLSSFPNLSSSPCDLDGDGTADINYSATKDTLSMVVAQLKGKLTDKDHLVVFVTDHGGMDNKTGKPYLCLWNSERVYADEFSEYFKGMDVGYVSFVLGQCYSGDFIPYLEATNHIVMTACAEGEKSYRCQDTDCDYNEFLYNWTSAINRRDPYGNVVTEVNDTMEDGMLAPVTMRKAFEYAVEKDAYNKGMTFLSVENPQISILENSTAEDLAMDTIPESIDLYIRSYKEDTGVRPYDRDFVFWNSPDLWSRSFDDGIENQTQQNIKFTENHLTNYLYAKVWNRGTRPYVYAKRSPKNRYVHFAWARGSFAITKKQWDGLLDEAISASGGHLGYSIIKDTIEPGDSAIIRYTWNADNGYEDDLVDIPFFHACLLAYITDNGSKLPRNVSGDSGIVEVWESDKIAQKNLIARLDKKEFANIYLGELLKPTDNLSVKCVDNIYEKSDVDKNEVIVRLSPSLFQKLSQDNFYGTTATYNKNPDYAFTLNKPDDKLGNISLAKGNDDYISLEVNTIADQSQADTLRHNINLALVDAEGHYVGGESLEVISAPRPRIDVSTSVSRSVDGGNTISVTDVSEDATYEWYDSDGNYVCSGDKIDVPSGLKDREYTVRVKSTKDSAVRYESVTVPKSSMISRIDIEEPNKMRVSLAYQARENTAIRVTSISSATPAVETPVEMGDDTCTIDMSDSVKGAYQVSLLENGQVQDTCKIIK